MSALKQLCSGVKSPPISPPYSGGGGGGGGVGHYIDRRITEICLVDFC